MTEEVATFGSGHSLVGILTNPPLASLPEQFPGIIILNAGVVHRVGPNRLSVKIARILGQLGFTTFRFDFSGIGDSTVRTDNLPYEKSIILETQEAMDYVQSAKGIGNFILLGICTGAMNSFEVARRDPRVRAAMLINPAGGFDRRAKAELVEYFSKRKKAQVIWTRRILDPKHWLRALTGQIDYANLRRILSFQVWSLFSGQEQLLPRTERSFDTLNEIIQQGVRVQFVFSGGDPATKNYFGALLKQRVFKRQFAEKVLIDYVDHADHTFTSLSTQPQFFQVIENFVLRCTSQENPRGEIRKEGSSVYHQKAFS